MCFDVEIGDALFGCGVSKAPESIGGEACKGGRRRVEEPGPCCYITRDLIEVLKIGLSSGI